MQQEKPVEKVYVDIDINLYTKEQLQAAAQALNISDYFTGIYEFAIEREQAGRQITDKQLAAVKATQQRLDKYYKKPNDTEAMIKALQQVIDFLKGAK